MSASADLKESPGAKAGSLHVLVCSFSYPPFRDGVSTAAAIMAEGLARRGHRVSVATTFHPDRAPAPGANPDVIQFRIEGGPQCRGGYRGEVREFQEWVLGLGADIVFSHCWYTWPTDLLMEMTGRLPARKVLVTQGFAAQLVEWHARFPWGLGQWLRWQPYVWSLPWLLRRWDWVVFLTARATLGRFFDHWVANVTGYRAHSIIPNSTASEGFPKDGSAFRETYGLGRGLLFLCVANYSTRKNQELAVRAFHRAALAEATLVFIGSELGDYGRRVEILARKLAAERPAGRVVLLEKVSPELTRAAFVACDVLILSAKAETQPFVILEAMACGKPWISTDTGCVSEFPGGLVVRGERTLARALQRLAADAPRRAGLGAEGVAAVRARYSVERVLDGYEELMGCLVPR